MTRIALVVSDVDGTMVTTDKVLTDGAKRAVQRLHDAGISFTIPQAGRRWGCGFWSPRSGSRCRSEPFNGSSIVDTDLKPIEQHLIPADAVRKSLDVPRPIWHRYLAVHQRAVDHQARRRQICAARYSTPFKHDPVYTDDFTPYKASACKIVGASADPALLGACETAMQKALGNEALAIRSQTYYLDITPPGQNKGTFVQAMAKRLGIATDAVATVGDMQNDLAMFKVSGLSVAMGNATDDVKLQATHVTTSNEDEGLPGRLR